VSDEQEGSRPIGRRRHNLAKPRRFRTQAL
jgi:hypothetical protein